MAYLKLFLDMKGKIILSKNNVNKENDINTIVTDFI